MQKTDDQKALTFYSEKGPDHVALKEAYDNTITELAEYFNQCRRSYDERRNYWPGKTEDLRKHGSDSFPWEGASDTEVHVINERINSYVALCLTSLNRANIRAYPVETGDMAQAKVISSFLKWMIASYIPRFKQEMELASNYLFERGLMITYVGWDREKNKYLQKFSIDDIAASNPRLASVILDGSDDTGVIGMLKSVFPDLKDRRAKKAIEELRTKGTCELTVSRRDIDRPCIKTCAPDGDVIFPPYCMDPQKAPYVFYKIRMTVQEILNKVEVAGWNAEWADYCIEHYRGQTTDIFNGNALILVIEFNRCSICFNIYVNKLKM